LYLMLFAIMTSCKRPYLPPIITSSDSYMVVEGGINGGPDSTMFKLSRTVKLSTNNTTNPVTSAVLTVEDNRGGSYPLTETTRGSYSAVLTLDNSKQYRLRIKTADNKQYLSDFVAVKNSPPIDSVNYKITNNGLNIYSNTHDDNNNTHYYRWDYRETWMIHSSFSSYFKSNGDTVLARDLNNDDIYTCWATNISSNINVSSTAKLTKDVVAENPIVFVSSTSEKLGIKYSILVRQSALTSDAYNFWVNLKKNTEQLGSIFDAQPSSFNGNIHSISNPLETVIGYISVGTVSTKRIFITSAQLPNWIPARAYPDCVLDTAYYVYIPPGSTTQVNQVNELINYHKGASFPLTPVDVIQPPGAPKPIGYSAAIPECVDCTLRGTNKKPVFWQ